jgi:hypothetical protein
MQVDWESLSMSTSRSSTLAEYIVALIDELGRADPGALERMQRVVGESSARIRLDEETVDLRFSSGRLDVTPADAQAHVNGFGATDSSTAVALLDGVLEVTDAILDGQLLVTGAAQDIARMFGAIEILLDATPRVPALSALADRFRSERAGAPVVRAPGAGGSPWYPFRSGQREEALLTRLGLI